jgi:hypothetical protein
MKPLRLHSSRLRGIATDQRAGSGFAGLAGGEAGKVVDLSE